MSWEEPGTRELGGLIYEGEFEADKRQGFGVLRLSDEAKDQELKLLRGKIELGIGPNAYWYSGGRDRIEGEFENDSPKKGKLFFTNGDVYDGSFHD